MKYKEKCPMVQMMASPRKRIVERGPFIMKDRNPFIGKYDIEILI